MAYGERRDQIFQRNRNARVGILHKAETPSANHVSLKGPFTRAKKNALMRGLLATKVR